MSTGHAPEYALSAQIIAALGLPDRVLQQLAFTGDGALPSVFAVTALAAASMGAAGLALASLCRTLGLQAGPHGTSPRAEVDRRLASLWFGMSLRPQGWTLPPAWDAVAGDYRAADGWIRLHTNAPHHRAAALAVLQVPAERAAVAQAVAGWQADALEAAVVAQGGCAGAMRSWAQWQQHPQGQAALAEPLLHWQTGAVSRAPTWAASARRPLQGLRVLDMTRVLAGPVATRMLAGLGAEVLRIDPPWWDEPGVVPEVTLGKRCAPLDLRQPADRDRWQALLQQADVLVHGYRADALDRLGLDAATRQQLRPGLVDVSLNAYGFSGPWLHRRGFDSIVQMSMGFAEAGQRAAGADKPVPLPVQALDHATGYILAAAALRGLEQRLLTGHGCRVRSSLARVGGLLMAAPPAGAEAAQPLAPETAHDWAPGIEHTAWGPARRLQWPLQLPGVHPAWALPAGPLGSTEAAWLSA